jgi:ABC-type histidine transport system ATPase subunit
MLERARRSRPLVHLFDEPQFSVQDGYIGFMLQFFRRLRDEGNVVLLCVHPNEGFHLEVLAESCERFLFVHQGHVLEFGSLDAVIANPKAGAYLGALATAAGSTTTGRC